MAFPIPREASRRAALWCAGFALLGAVLVALYPDSHQQDGGCHYVLSRWAYRHPVQFVSVWARPLFTFLYALPAQLGYTAAKLFTVAVSVIAGWQTFRLAEEQGLPRAELAVPLLWVQPCWVLLCAETMTEPLFALVFAIALRLHLRGRVQAGMLLASLLPLARPEGFFLGILWGVWVLLDRREARPFWKRLTSTALLAFGAVVWWAASFAITGDPLYIKHKWPWPAQAGLAPEPIWSYAGRLHEIVGPLLIPVFVLGLGILLARRRLGHVTSAFLLLFVLHSVLHAFGLFGSPGYARYLVGISPAIALISLAGWNAIAERLPRLGWARAVTAAAVLALSLVAALIYVDAEEWARDARGIERTVEWFRANPRPVRRLYASQRYMTILFDNDDLQEPYLGWNRDRNLSILREAPPRTLVIWDDEVGKLIYSVTSADLVEAGYKVLRADDYVLPGLLLSRLPPPFHDDSPDATGFGKARRLRVYLFYKEG